jgi:hypothetical protein
MKQAKPISPPRRSGLSDSDSSEGEDKKVEDKTVTPPKTVLSSRCVTPTEEDVFGKEDSTSAIAATREVVPSSVSPSPCASPRKHKASEPLEAKQAKHVKFADDAKPEDID